MGASIGVDSHKGSLAAAAVDELGRVLEVREFPNDPEGHRALLEWARRYEARGAIGIEGSGAYGAGLCRMLTSAGEQVVEVPATLTFRERRRKASKGKSDAVDAVAIARVVARGEDLPSPLRTQVLVDLKLLSDYRDQLVHTRTQLANRVHRDLVVLHPGYERAVPNLIGARHLAKALSLVEAGTSVRAELVRRRIGELRRLALEIAETKARLTETLAQSGTTLTAMPGVGPVIAAKILGEVGDVGRIRSQGSFAMMAGTAPLVASSGMTSRHRLNRGGNRKLNFALHYMALVRYRSAEETRNYIERRLAEGKTYKEGGVYLVPADPGVRRLCQRAARGLAFLVPCPSLLPTGSTLGAACAPCGGYFGLTFSFTGPPGYVGVPSSEAGQPGSGHLNVWAIPIALNSGPNGGLVGCAGSKIGHATAFGHPAVWMVCPTGSEIDSGHVVLGWRSGGIAFGVSLHGDTALNRRLVLAVVTHVRMIA